MISAVTSGQGAKFRPSVPAHCGERHERPQRHQRQSPQHDALFGHPWRVRATPAATAAIRAVLATPAHQDAQLFLTLFDDLIDFGNLRSRIFRPAARRLAFIITSIVATIIAARAATAPPGTSTCHSLKPFFFVYVF